MPVQNRHELIKTVYPVNRGGQSQQNPYSHQGAKNESTSVG